MTQLKMMIRCPDAASRNAALETGMTDGMSVAFALMEPVLRALGR